MLIDIVAMDLLIEDCACFVFHYFIDAICK